jgi:hypothetical protein
MIIVYLVLQALLQMGLYRKSYLPLRALSDYLETRVVLISQHTEGGLDVIHRRVICGDLICAFFTYIGAFCPDNK